MTKPNQSNDVFQRLPNSVSLTDVLRPMAGSTGGRPWNRAPVVDEASRHRMLIEAIEEALKILNEDNQELPSSRCV